MHSPRHHDLGDGGIQRSLDDGEHRTPLDRGGNEVVAVSVLARFGDEDVAGADQSRVGVDGARNHRVSGVGAAEDEGSAEDIGDSGQSQTDHAQEACRRDQPNVGRSGEAEFEGMIR